MVNHRIAAAAATASCVVVSTPSVVSLLGLSTQVDGFQPSCVLSSSPTSTSRLYSSTGDGPSPPPDDENEKLDDFFNLGEESEGLKKAREYMSESSLPISFELELQMKDDDDLETDSDKKIKEEKEDVIVNDDDVYKLMDDDELEDDDERENDVAAEKGEATEASTDEAALPSSSSAMVLGGDPSIYDANGLISEAALAKNPYMQVVSKLTPSQLISKFTATANPRVQEAVRTTILGLIGSLPKMAFDTTTITSGQRLASLMFQLQMTGYMFKNAEYRLSMSQSLGMTNGYSPNMLLPGTTSDEDDDDDDDPLTTGKVKGKLKVHYGDKNSGMDIEVDAAAYMSELRSEVARLKDELAQSKEAKDEALKKDLLMYIRTLPRQELQSLTDTMSKDVLVCMKGLVQAVLGGIGDGQITAETVTEQSGEAMAQLCMWQLAVGYNLRELEVREEMKQNLKQILGGKDGSGDGVDLSEPDALE